MEEKDLIKTVELCPQCKRELLVVFLVSDEDDDNLVYEAFCLFCPYRDYILGSERKIK